MSAPPAPAPPAAPATLLTAAEFTQRYANVHAELVKGIVKEYPVPFLQHGMICFTMAHALAPNGFLAEG